MSHMSMTLAEFANLLDVYGGERTRWPAEARAAAAHLVSREVEARRLLAEAEALDRVLERAPRPALAVEAALAERIVAAALRSPRMVKLEGGKAATAEASAQGAAVPPVADASAPRPQPQLRARPSSRTAGAVGFLAASLAIGVVIGHSSLSRQLVPELADLAWFPSDTGGLTQIALSDEVMQ
jgi:hypothetical protein